MSDQVDLFTPKQSEEVPQIRVPHLKTVFSISCGMSARHFFALLKKHNKPLLIDTRRSRSYGRARFSFAEDLEYLCELHNIPYTHMLDLAPTQLMRTELHKVFSPKVQSTQEDRARAWTRFLYDYMAAITKERRVLREGNPLRIVIDSAHTGIAVMCACQHHLDCHRHVATGMIAKWVHGVKEVHLSPEEVGGSKPSRKSPRRYLIDPIPGANIETSPPRG